MDGESSERYNGNDEGEQQNGEDSPLGIGLEARHCHFEFSLSHTVQLFHAAVPDECRPIAGGNDLSRTKYPRKLVANCTLRSLDVSERICQLGETPRYKLPSSQPPENVWFGSKADIEGHAPIAYPWP